MSKIIQKKFFEEITFFGGIFFYIFLIVLFLVLDKINYSLRLVLGLIIIYFLTFIIRLFYFKPRPRRMEYNNFIEKLDASSFPSVHAARATFLFLFAIISFFPSLYVSILIFVLFLAVIYSRIYLLKHDLVDIIGGILLGIVSLASLLIV